MLGSRGMRGKFGHCRRSQTTLNSELGFHALPVSGSRSESSTLGSEVSSLIYMSDAYNPLSNSLVFASIPVFQSIMSLMINSFQTILFVVGCQYAWYSHGIIIIVAPWTFAVRQYMRAYSEWTFNENPLSCGSIAYNDNGVSFVFKWCQFFLIALIRAGMAKLDTAITAREQ